MTLMLASVLSRAEAEIAVARGADIIDCKDPSRGALGALALAEIAAIVAVAAGRRPVSAVVELPHDVSHARQAIEDAAASGVEFVKFALPITPDAQEIVDALAPVASRARSRRHTNGTLRSYRDLDSLCGLPVLAGLPKIPHNFHNPDKPPQNSKNRMKHVRSVI